VIWLLPKLFAVTWLIVKDAPVALVVFVPAPEISKGDPGTVDAIVKTPEVFVTLIFLIAPEDIAAFIDVCKAAASAATDAVPEAADVILVPLMVTVAVSVVA
jgi:hypothetical protein